MHGSGSDDAVVDAVLHASRALVAVAARSVAAVDEALTLAQFRTLVVLAGRGPQNVGALAEELGVHSSTATRMCDRLERRGLIARQPSEHSRREVTVRLAPPGRRLLNRVTAVRRQAIGDIVRRVPRALRPAMVQALQAFAEAAGEVPDQAWAAGWDEP
jgi:DNA-binding MarR family transcriptional regulator